LARATHLAKRFFGSVVPRAPSATDAAWVTTQLTPAELELWQQMPRADRRHSVGVARRVEQALGDEATRPVLAAALLHDVGKLDANLGVYGRVIATISGSVVRQDQDTIRDWTRTRGFTRRVGLYLQHPRLGGDMLALAGSDPLTVAWTREHHLPAEDWTVPEPAATALKDADDD
jgi:hypothetical protein